MTVRYAIYAAPLPGTRLAEIGAALLGYDAELPADVTPLVPAGIDPDEWSALSEEPRRYGFHGTLKAPFALAEGTNVEQLVAHAISFAAGRDPFEVPLHLARLGRFLALVPETPSAELEALADQAVGDFDRFRAPLSDRDRQRRHASGLTPRQAEHLERWGYPYVFDQFRFHMTLTGKVPPERLDDVEARLRETVRRELGRPALTVASVALFEQARPGERFRVAAHFPLAG
jgi:putative phosphonate metabolism protein